MREIKFRGKRIHNDEWVYGSYFSSDEMPKRGEVGHFIKSGLNEEFRVRPETVGQFTGRENSNGKEVYEHDIVKCKDTYKDGIEFMGVVDFQDCSFVIKNDCVTHYRWMDYEVEVVGNIWENPELIEKDHDNDDEYMGCGWIEYEKEGEK